MQKPTSILKNEFTNSLASLINNCGLDSIIIESVISDALRTVKTYNANKLKSDIVAWEAEQKRLRGESSGETAHACAKDENIVQ